MSVQINVYDSRRANDAPEASDVPGQSSQAFQAAYVSASGQPDPHNTGAAVPSYHWVLDPSNGSMISVPDQPPVSGDSGTGRDHRTSQPQVSGETVVRDHRTPEPSVSGGQNVIQGQWAPPLYPGSHWVPGHWEPGAGQTPPGLHFQEGHWASGPDGNPVWLPGHWERDRASNCGNPQPPALNPNAMTTTPLPGGGIDVTYKGADGSSHEVKITPNGDLTVDGQHIQDGNGLGGGTVSKDGNTITITGSGEQMTVTAGPNGLQTSVIPLPQSAVGAPPLTQGQTNAINAQLKAAGLPDLGSVLKNPGQLSQDDLKKVQKMVGDAGGDLNKLLNGTSGTNGSSTSSDGVGGWHLVGNQWVNDNETSDDAALKAAISHELDAGVSPDDIKAKFANDPRSAQINSIVDDEAKIEMGDGSDPAPDAPAGTDPMPPTDSTPPAADPSDESQLNGD